MQFVFMNLCDVIEFLTCNDLQGCIVFFACVVYGVDI